MLRSLSDRPTLCGESSKILSRPAATGERIVTFATVAGRWHALKEVTNEGSEPPSGTVPGIQGQRLPHWPLNKRSLFGVRRFLAAFSLFSTRPTRTATERSGVSVSAALEPFEDCASTGIAPHVHRCATHIEDTVHGDDDSLGFQR